MNCKNCGFTNKPDERKCIKCQKELELNSEEIKPSDKSNSSLANIDNSRTLRGKQPNDAFIDRADINVSSTIWGEQAKEPYIDLANDKAFLNSGETPINCPHCGFQQFTGGQYCPNCNNDITKNPGIEFSNPKKYSGTVDPYSRKSFSLRPIINGAPGNNKLEFQGNTELNRDNTIKDNNTITSNVQAEIMFDSGEWYLVDRSEKQTTFIRPGKPIKLNKGDIILLGDTKFIFD